MLSNRRALAWRASVLVIALTGAGASVAATAQTAPAQDATVSTTQDTTLPQAATTAQDATRATAQSGVRVDETTAADGSENKAGEILVTGSRIRRGNFSSTEPLTIITRGEMTQAGFSSATDALQSNAIT